MAAPVVRFTKANKARGAPGYRPPEMAKPPESTWFSDRQTLVRFSHNDQGDNDSIWLLSYSDMMTLLFGFFVFLMSFSKIDVESFEKTRREATVAFGGEYKKPHEAVKDAIGKMQNDGLQEKVAFDELEKGIAITFRGSLFFDPGSAEIKPEARELLEKVIPSIKNQSYRFNVVVEGHTDDSPIASEKFPSNWELSSQRASAVIRLFEEHGFARSQLRAIGYADTLPILPNRDTQNSPIAENQSQNRRVVIKLLRSGEMNSK